MALPKNVQEAINKQSGKLLKNDFERIVRIKFEQIKTEMIKEFLNSLLEDYRILLQNEYHHITTRESVMETIRINEYEFLENGKLA